MCGGPLKCGGPCSAEHVRTLVNPALSTNRLELHYLPTVRIGVLNVTPLLSFNGCLGVIDC